MKSFIQFLREDAVDIDAIQHHGHMVGLYHTRNDVNPTTASKKREKEYREKLSKHGVVSTSKGGLEHPDPDAHDALKAGVAQGVDAEWKAQPKSRTNPNHPRYVKPHHEKDPRVGLGAYLKATRSFNRKKK